MTTTAPALPMSRPCQACSHLDVLHRGLGRCTFRERTGTPIHAGGHGIRAVECSCRAFVPTYDPPVEPVDETVDCPHCAGTGVVDDDWEVNGQLVGAEFRCNRCDGEGVAPVDAEGVCACAECLLLPRDQRARIEL